MYIGIDCGTQGIKVAIWNGETDILGVGYNTYPLISDDTGLKEQEPSWWLESLITAMDEAFNKAQIARTEIKGIGVSGQQHGLVLLDNNNEIIRPAKLWCDTQPTDILKNFTSENALDYSNTIGINVPVAFTIAKLLWTKKHKPEDFGKISKIMLPHEYINYWLTGNYFAEAGDSSGTGYFDTYSKKWSTKLFELIGMPDSFVLPELISSEQCHGTIRPKLAKQLGLSESVVVSSGGGDNMMAAIGTGNVSKGLLTMSLGTSGTVYSHTLEQVDSTTYPDLNAFCSSTNGYLPLASTMNVTSATTAFRNLLNTDIPTFEQMISRVPVGSNGITVMPYLAGARLPNVPKAKGAIFGLTSDNLNQENLLRAAVEGVTYNLAKGVDVLSQAGLSFDSVILIGGGSNSATWRQMISNVTGLTVNVPDSGEAAALGAAMQAKWAYSHRVDSSPISIADICSIGIKLNPLLAAAPDLEAHSRYQELYTQYHQEVEQYVKGF
ncbi:xylulokinase [Vibrio hannami]|uniref:xylulokinase n=1 Tax=Vibrio hannami TaxID=2717094 RepID=UPI00240EC085|nr:xylulokinase [Vibrio hannami]MDG3085057.1 xylulokinase [Vibrio hannami]